MNTEQALQARSESGCELCSATDKLTVYPVPPDSDGSADQCVLLCEACREQIDDPDKVDVNHWRCLNDSMWSQVPAVQVLVWRMLTRLRAEGWPQALLDMLYQASHQYSLESCPIHGPTPLRSSTTILASDVLVTFAIASALK